MPADGPEHADRRPLWPALRRGFRRRCPNCAAGSMFRGYLSIRDTCPVCGQELHHQRAGDIAALATFVIVTLVMAPLIVVTQFLLQPEPLIMISVFSVGTVALSLYLLPRFKGAVIAWQWARRKHGFAANSAGSEAAPAAHGDETAAR